MVRHFIIMSDAYLDKARIALDIIEKDMNDIEHINEIILKIKEKCNGETPFSTHSIPTDTENWESVLKADPYFKNVKVINDVEEFVNKIIKNRKLTGVDVGDYIVNKIICTKLKLQKLCYLCYADYLCKTKNKLFEDDIFAFKYGPVVETIFKKFKDNEDTLVANEDNLVVAKKDQFKLPSEIRILHSENGIEKLQSINKTLEEYGKFSAATLVTITHNENTPWQHAYKGGRYDKISDEDILNWHNNEKTS